MSRPNILWLSLESVRADHTSLYGYSRDTTPNLNELSERPDATVLDPMISASMWTPASTASMLTGTHMSTHQVGRDGEAKEKLPEGINTLPELLSEEGYNTALFSTNPYISPSTGLDRGFDHFEMSGVSYSNFYRKDSVLIDSVKHAVSSWKDDPTFSPLKLKRNIGRGGNDLLEYRVKRWFKNNGRNQPLFAYAHIQSPHHPYRPVSRYISKYIDEIKADEDEAISIVDDVYPGFEGIRRQIATGLNLSEKEREAIIAMYDSEINHADYTASQLISAARSASQEPLIIVVAGDHGELFGEYGLIGHNLVLHDNLIKVPSLIVGIDGITETSETVSQHIDLTYTIADIADVKTDQFEGRDLHSEDRPYAVSQRGVAPFEDYTKYNSEFDTTQFLSTPFTSIRTPEWKYLKGSSEEQLYGLPNETDDVSKENPDLSDTLSGYISDENINWEKSITGANVEFDEEQQERLRNLGYIS